MTASQTMTAAPMPDAARARRRPHAFGNLLRKELRESRNVIIAGLWIFWAMPVLVQLLFAAGFSREHEMVPGFTWVPLIAAGWLYTIVVGAHTVCRDWGKPEEHFLLGRPVSVRSVVVAKFLAGALVVTLVAAVAGLWDVAVAVFRKDWSGELAEISRDDVETFLCGVVLLICVFAVSYAFAFAAAVVTRQMLAGTLFAGLALLLWLTGPLVSHRLQFLYPRLIVSEYVERPSPLLGALVNVGPVFLGIVITAIVACVAIALFSSTRERVIRVGHKPLAWTVALVVLALFTAAMGEVGNSLTVCDEASIPALQLTPSGTYANDYLVAHHADRCFLLSTPSPNADSADWPLATFRVGARGHIEGLRTTVLPDSSVRHPQRCWMSDFRCDAAGDLVIQGLKGLARSPKDGARWEELRQAMWQTRVAWPGNGKLIVLSHAELWAPRARESDRIVLRNSAVTDAYAYLVYVDVPEGEPASDAGDRKSGWPTTLYVFSWSDGVAPRPRYEIPLAPGSHVAIEDGRLTIFKPVARDSGSKDWDWYVARFDANHPESIGDARSAHYERGRPHDKLIRRYELVDRSKRPGGGDPWWIDGKGVLYVGDRFGLRIIRDNLTPGASEPALVGEYRASPLAMLFRVRGELSLVDNSLLVEFAGTGLIAYDVSDPAHPRRVGFLNTTMTGGNGSILGVNEYLVLIHRQWGGKGWLPVEALTVKRPVRPG